MHLIALLRNFTRILPIVLLTLVSCARNQDDSALSQMRVRSMQTHSFVGYSSREVTKEILSVLQDEGYMIKSVSSELGLLTAELDTNIEKFSSKFWSSVFKGKQARWKKHSLLEMTSNISEEGENTKVRINYLVRVYDNLGRIVDVHQIFDERAYQEFYIKVQKGLFSKQR